MKVLYLSAAKNVGGGNRSLLALCRGMEELAEQTQIIVPAPGAMTTACEEDRVPWSVAPFPQPSWREPWNLFRCHHEWGRVFRRFRPDIIHANELMPARSIMLAASRFGLPVVCHMRFPLRPEAIQWAFRWIPKPSSFIFNSHSLKADMGPAIGDTCPNAVQHVVHNAVDLDRFTTTPKAASSESKIGIVANLLRVKGHPDFLQMARLLRDRGFRCRYQIIGADIHDTGYGEELKKLAQDLDVSDIVDFLGHRSDVADLVSDLDIVVCASHVEPFGRCVMEAMACGKPVVSTDVGGLPEVVGEDGVAGRLVPARSPEALAEAVAQLLNDGNQRQRMGMAGRTRTEELFSIGQHTNRIHNIYRELLGGQNGAERLSA